MKGEKVFVAGGAGLVGTSLVNRLLEEGASVSASFHTRPPESHREFYKRLDLAVFDDCLAATRGVDRVFLAAARRFGGKTLMDNPTASLLPNLQIQAGMLEACRRNRVGKVVLISSSTVYQESSTPLREDDLDLNKPLFEGHRGVGWLNRYAEQLALHHMQAHGMPVWIVRPTNIYGPHDDFNEETANVIPALIARAERAENPFIVWGDGRAVRDFLFIDDLVEDLLAWTAKGPAGVPVNMGSGTALTVREAVETVLEASGLSASVEYDESKPRGIPYRVLDITRLQERLGPRPRTPFADSIRRTIEWRRTRSKASSGGTA